jgi:hypothetical protein
VEPEAVAALESVTEAAPAVEPEPEPFAAPPEPEAGVAPQPVIEPRTSEPARAGSLPSFPPGVSLDEEIAAYDLRMAALAAQPPPSPAFQAPPPPMFQPAAASATPMSPAPTPAPTPRIVPAVVPDLPAASEAALPAAQAAASCPSCGLALSATARFCRRCGTAQQH